MLTRAPRPAMTAEVSTRPERMPRGCCSRPERPCIATSTSERCEHQVGASRSRASRTSSASAARARRPGAPRRP
jgi:hypothetical protein